MSMTFNVDVGPLAQIDLEIASLSTAYHLATGTYGWYKAKKGKVDLLAQVGLRQSWRTSRYQFI